MDPCPWHVLSLCSGSAGLDLGLGLAVAGAGTVCYVEVEAYLGAVLAARMEDGCLAPAPVWTDLATFDGRPWRGVVHCVAAGYPCTPFSRAGSQLGSADIRYLWPEVARIVAEVQPACVFLENVAQHLWDGFERVQRELQAMGYRVAAGLFSSAEVGAPFEGERLFALAATGNTGVARLLPGRDPCLPGPWGWGGQEDLQALAESPLLPHRGRPQPLLRRVDDGLADWLDRLRAVGNGVTPLVAAAAFRALYQELFPEGTP